MNNKLLVVEVSWPANVRKLQNQIKRAVTMTDDKQISSQFAQYKLSD